MKEGLIQGCDGFCISPRLLTLCEFWFYSLAADIFSAIIIYYDNTVKGL